MNLITRKDNIARKILIILLIALTLIFAIKPNYKVYADTVEITEEDIPDSSSGIMSSLLKQIIQIIDAVGDIVMGALNKFMLGTDGISSAMLATSNDNIGNPDSWLYAGDAEPDFKYGENTIDTSDFLPWVDNKYDVPNFLYSPESIFTNNIAVLDVNFLNPNEYNAISQDSDSAEEASKSAAGGVLGKVISDWYISFRNIAIVGLLSVLIYLGIRIVISSTAGDKAKYKEHLQNWVVALCLVFFIHFIMSGLLMITDKFNNLFETTANEGIVIQAVNPDGGADIKFKTNIIGYIRFNAQSRSTYDAAAYSILYLALVIYTCVFTIMYFKRFLNMAFLTMIAPLVALTYPIDKAGDSKAQAFNYWFKEYIMNLILQPVHLILYIALVSSAMELVKSNIIYALVAMGFLIPAEKLIKEMFGFKANTTSGFGSFAAGAATMSGLKKLASLGSGKNKSSSNKENSEESNSRTDDRIRMQDRSFLGTFNDNNTEGGQQNSQRTDDHQNSQRTDRQQDDRQQDDRQQNEQDDERRRLLDDRSAWQEIADNPDTSDMDREEALQQVDTINDDMRERGFLDEAQEEEREEERESGQQPQQVDTTNNAELIPNKGWRRKLALKGAKKVGKAAYKGAKKVGRAAVRVPFGVAGGMVGLAAGITTGDMSKAMSFMGAGALAGSSIGKSVANKTIDGASAIRNQVDKFQYEKDKAKYGIGEATKRLDQRQNDRAKINFMKNEAEKEKYEEMAGRISKETGKDVDAKALMESAFDYKKAGITDEKQIERGLTMETKHDSDSNIHENMIDIVGMTKDYGKEYVLDDKKRAAVQDTIKSTVNGESNQDRVWNLYTETLGFKNLDSKYAMQRTNNNAQDQRGGRTRTTPDQRGGRTRTTPDQRGSRTRTSQNEGGDA